MIRKPLLISELKARRQALGWSLSELSDRCAIDEQILHDWERGAGSPRLDAADRWAAALGLKLTLAPSEDGARRGLSVDWRNRHVSIDGVPLRLTPMEWKALERLAAAPGELVTHEALFHHLYGDERPYVRSTAIRVLITKLRRLLPLRIEAQWGRGYVIFGVEPSPPRTVGGADDRGDASAASPTAVEAAQRVPVPHASHPAPRSSAPALRELVEHAETAIRRPAAPPVRLSARRAEELQVIERFLAERGATRCPDVASIERSPLPALVWDKVKRKWVRPGLANGEAG